MPHTRTRPADGTRIPQSSLIVVDFPAPFGPTYATDSPDSIDRSISSTAVTSVYRGRTRCLREPDRPAVLTGRRKRFVNASAVTIAPTLPGQPVRQHVDVP